ncbi:hypothetical protein [Caloranaerobacter ferrireducens]|uniref:hypothetical protein n=1 Tax=Caloranaerobacter ferrireducens TaxID=1323370 RepID=UPI00084D3043|nr:hypothetical protein [Caloranaerobacter ferrireducens]
MRTEREFQNWLMEVIYEGNEALFEGEEIEITTFEEEGLLTNNKGLVIKLEDGTEFQLTLIKSR